MLSLPYLAFIALLIWALAVERERGEADLSERNASSIAPTTPAVFIAGQRAAAGRLNMRFLLVSSVLQVQRLTHYQRLAIYVREGDALALNFQVGFPAVFDEHRARVPLPPAWQRRQSTVSSNPCGSRWSPTIPWALACATCPCARPAAWRAC